MEAPVGPEEGLLDEVLGVGRVAGQAERGRVQPLQEGKGLGFEPSLQLFVALRRFSLTHGAP